MNADDSTRDKSFFNQQTELAKMQEIIKHLHQENSTLREEYARKAGELNGFVECLRVFFSEGKHNPFAESSNVEELPRSNSETT